MLLAAAVGSRAEANPMLVAFVGVQIEPRIKFETNFS